MKNSYTRYQLLMLKFFFGCFVAVQFFSFLHVVNILYSPELLPLDRTLTLPLGVPSLFAFFPGMTEHPTWYPVAFCIIGMMAGISIAFHVFSRTASLVALWIIVSFYNVNPLAVDIGSQMLGMLLCIFAILPYPPAVLKHGLSAPSSLTLQPLIFLALWINFAVQYSYSGYTKILSYLWYDGQVFNYILQHPVARGGFLNAWAESWPYALRRLATWFVAYGELLAPLAFLHRYARMFLWVWILLIQIALLLFMNLWQIQVLMLIYSFLVFDPGWIRPKYPLKKGEKLTVYYDGVCVLCNTFVGFILNEDLQGKTVFTPLQKSQEFSNKEMTTFFVRATDGRLLSKSDALIYLLEYLGGYWRLFAKILRVIPRFVRDTLYLRFGKLRYTLFGRRSDSCPMLPPGLSDRFHFEIP